MADPSEGRERARQEFEKWMAEWGPAFSLEKWPDDAQLGTYRGMDTEDCWHAFQAGRRSLEQERDELRKIPKVALDWSNNLADEYQASKSRATVYDPNCVNPPTRFEWSDEAKKYAAECLATVAKIQYNIVTSLAPPVPKGDS